MKYLIVGLMLMSCKNWPEVKPMTDCERSCKTSCEFGNRNNVGKQMMCELECNQLECEKSNAGQ